MSVERPLQAESAVAGAAVPVKAKDEVAETPMEALASHLHDPGDGDVCVRVYLSEL